MAEPKPARPEDLPKTTHEGKTTIFGIEVRTYRLDDGRAVIHADDFHKLIEAVGFADTFEFSSEVMDASDDR